MVSCSRRRFRDAKLGEERSQALQEVISEDGIIVEKYRDRKLLERYLESVALKYDMTLAELSLLLYRKDAGKALTEGLKRRCLRGKMPWRRLIERMPERR